MVCLVCFIKLYQKQNVYDIPDIHYHYENTNYLFNINQWILNSKISRRIKTLPDGNNDIRTWMRSCVHGYGDVRTWMRSCVHGYRDVRTLRLTPARTSPAVGERRTPRPCCSWSPLWGHWTPPWCPCTPPHSSWSSGTPSCLFGILHSLLFKKYKCNASKLKKCMIKKWKTI